MVNTANLAMAEMVEIIGDISYYSKKLENHQDDFLHIAWGKVSQKKYA